MRGRDFEQLQDKLADLRQDILTEAGTFHEHKHYFTAELCGKWADELDKLQDFVDSLEQKEEAGG